MGGLVVIVNAMLPSVRAARAAVRGTGKTASRPDNDQPESDWDVRDWDEQDWYEQDEVGDPDPASTRMTPNPATKNPATKSLATKNPGTSPVTAGLLPSRPRTGTSTMRPHTTGRHSSSVRWTSTSTTPSTPSAASSSIGCERRM